MRLDRIGQRRHQQPVLPKARLMAEPLDRRSFITGVAAVAAAAALPSAPKPIIWGLDLAAPGSEQTVAVCWIDGHMHYIRWLDVLMDEARKQIADVTGINSELFNGR